MKAIIIPNESGDIGDLRLRLVDEGANDRTLMRLLEAQYPAIRRVPDALEVPIISQAFFNLPNVEVMRISSEAPIASGGAVRITTVPWAGAPRVVTLHVVDSESWALLSVLINGRHFDGTAPFEIWPGMIVEVTAGLRKESGSRDFVAELRTQSH